MKTPVLVVIVVMLHVAAIGSLFFIQGCGATRPPAAQPPVPQIPPPVAPAPLPPPEIARPMPPPARPAAAPFDTAEYVVRSGDTLSKIAAHHKAPLKQIMDLNKISDPNKIRVGQKLIIPVRPGVTLHHPSKSASLSAAPKKAPPAGTEYVVQAGDTLGGIAHRFKTKVSALRELNKIEGDKILIGQKLAVAGDNSAAAKPDAPESTPAPAVEDPPQPVPSKSPVEESPELAVPAADEESAPADAPAIAPSEQEIIHTVMPNEDLDYIARLYVVPVDQIVKLNNLPERKIQVGQRLRIP